MAAWASPLLFRVHAAYSTGMKLRTEPQREDEQKWEWVIPEKERVSSVFGSNTAAKSAGSDDRRPDKQKLDQVKPKNETASLTGSNDSRPVPPRQPVPSRSKLKTPSAGSSPCGTGLLPRQSRRNPNAG